jgi:hypothetical protein
MNKPVTAQLIESNPRTKKKPRLAFKTRYQREDIHKDKWLHDDERILNALGDELVEWAKSDSSLVIDKFPTLKGYSSNTFFRIGSKYSHFVECVEIAKDLIANRLHEAYFSKKIDTTYLFKILPLYSWRYKEDRDAIIAKAALTNAQKQTIELFTISESELVTKKLESNGNRDNNKVE